MTDDLSSPDTVGARCDALWQQAVGLGPDLTQPPPDPQTLPVLRLVRNLPRVGGTLLARCLASMEGVCLLSEINLFAPTFNPLRQMRDWCGPLPEAVLARLEQGPTRAIDVLAAAQDLVTARGHTLVMRDWALLEFLLPHLSPTPLTDGMTPELRYLFRPRQVVMVRHPLDTLGSLSTLTLTLLMEARAEGRFTLDSYLQGYAAFLAAHAGVPVVRYEDLLATPDATLERVCEVLDVPFDPGYRERFGACDRVTGGTQYGALFGSQFVHRPRSDAARRYGAALAEFPLYHELLARLGYTEEAP